MKPILSSNLGGSSHSIGELCSECNELDLSFSSRNDVHVDSSEPLMSSAAAHRINGRKLLTRAPSQYLSVIDLLP